jgi:intracellular sulfur oxidation DsrE/DsrF family protein
MREDSMHRRNLFRAALASVGAAFAATAVTKAQAASPDKSKVVYHLNETDKVQFVIGNIENHFEGVGGPDKVTIVLVVHGPALRAFHAASANPDVKHRFASLVKAGVAPAVCGNTMKGQKVTLSDLLPGFVSLEQGGVVRIAELQSQGYVYLRP